MKPTLSKLPTASEELDYISPSLAHLSRLRQNFIIRLKAVLPCILFTLSLDGCTTAETSCPSHIRPNAERLDAGPAPQQNTIPSSSNMILRASVSCDRSYRDETSWCDHTDYSPEYCDSLLESDRAGCRDRLAKCGVLWDRFKSCIDSLPIPQGCDERLNPLSLASDADGDGLSDHLELWHLGTNPCEPCSQGANELCDAEADHNNNGITNLEENNRIGGCMSHIPTDECG